MQASQSSTASDLLAQDLLSRDLREIDTKSSKAELKPDSAFPRGLPSPFSAPILAARRYFERQRGDGWQTGSREAEAAHPDGAQDGSSQKGGTHSGVSQNVTAQREQNPAARQRSSGDDPRLEALRREQDRRLERSLYEGHAIEAGYSSAAIRTDEGSGAENKGASEIDGVYPAEGDGPEVPFSYAVPGSLPDPEAVRGAISRLSRESELHLAAGAVGDATLHGAAGGAATRTLARTATQTAAPAAAGSSRYPGAVRPAGPAEPAQPVQPLSFGDVFGDVARRVWGAHSEAAFPEETDSPRQDAAHPSTPSGSLAAHDVAREVRGTGATDASVQVRSANRQETGTETWVEAGVEVAVNGSGQTPRPGETRNDVRPDRSKTAEAAVPVPAADSGPLQFKASETPAEADCEAGDGPALAHDACNLLSALALYSELLASPGVLGEQHRHYAEELKLMAGRSQALIDRLLCGEAAAKASAAPEAAPLDAAAIASAAAVPDGIGSDGLISGGPICSGPAPRATGGLRAGESGGDEVEARQPAAAQNADPGTARLDPRPITAAAAPDAPTVTEPEATNLVDLLMRWGSLLSTLAHGTLEVVLGPHAATPVPSGAEALERILVNLVRNARAATVEGGAIRIGVAATDLETLGESGAGREDEGFSASRKPGGVRTVVLTVDDSGCGMTEAQVRRILGQEKIPVQSVMLPAPEIGTGGQDRLDPQLEASSHALDRSSASGHSANASTRGEQTRRHGLGLKIVRQLVAESGGTLSIESWPGRGTRVEIRWPVALMTSAERPDAPVPRAEPRSELAARSALPAGPEYPHAALPAPVAVEGRLPDAAPAVVEAAGAGVPPPVLQVSGAIAETASGAEDPLPSKAQAAGDGVGPDGFSEAELRAMMLRLHRTAPQQRTPLGRGLGEWRQTDARQTGGRAERSGSVQEDRAAKGAIAC